MRHRHAATLTAVALVAAITGGVFTASMGRLSGQTSRLERPERIEGRPNFSGIWQANNEANWDLEAHAARPAMITQPGVYPYEYARLPAPPVVALGAVAAVPGSLGVVQGDGRIPYTPRGAGPQTGERRELGRPGSGNPLLPAGHSARHVHAAPVRDHPEHEQDSHGLRIQRHRPHDSHGRGGAAARLHLDGPLGRPLGGRHAGSRRGQLPRQRLVRPRPAITTAAPCASRSASRW